MNGIIMTRALTIAARRIAGKLNRGVITISYDGQVMDHEEERTFNDLSHVLPVMTKEACREIKARV